MLIRTLLNVLLALVATTTQSIGLAEDTYVEGTHYEVIDIPVETGLEAERPRKVEVVEVLSRSRSRLQDSG